MACKIVAATAFAACVAARSGWEWGRSDYVQGKGEGGVTTWEFVSLLTFMLSGVIAVGGLSKLITERRQSVYLDAVLAVSGVAGCIATSAYGPWVSSAHRWNTMLSSLSTVYCAWLVLHVMLRYSSRQITAVPVAKLPQEVEDPERTSLMINTSTPTLTRYTTSRTQRFLILSVFLPILFVATTALPNAWGSYTTPGIIRNLKDNGSSGRAIAIHLTDAAILKMYPDVMIYYTFLWLAVLFEGNWKVLRLLFLALLVAWVTYWTTYHWQGGMPGLSTRQKVARTFGQCAVLALALTYLPVGVWSKDLRAHKYLGRSVFGVSFAHMVAFLTTYTSFPHDFFMTPYWTRDDFTVPMMTYAWLVSFVAIFMLSLRPVRQRFFEVFIASHMVFVHVFTFAVLVHAASAWYFLAPSVLLYFLKKAQLHTVHVDNARVERIDGDHVAMELPGYSTRALVVKVKCSSVSGLEWHPFSVANPGAEETLLIAKVQGEGSWTQRLHEGCFESLCVAADPMRHPAGDMFRGYGTVVAVCGGVGVTHGMGVLSVMAAQGCDVHLVWVHGSAELEKYVLQAVPDHAREKVTAVARYEHPSRESTFDAVAAAVQDAVKGKESTAVMTLCGPAPFVKQAKVLGSELGCDVHVEQF